MHYFASDMHLGLHYRRPAVERERLFVRWLDEVSADAEAIFLVGDVFDFWYEYKRVVPKGFVRTLGKIAELTDRGVEVHFFAGNHDMWVADYFERECGMKVHTTGAEFMLSGRRVYIDHGDYLLPHPKFLVRAMNSMFRSRALRWMFSHFIHPDLALRFGHWWSRHSRHSRDVKHNFRGERETTVQFARKRIAEGRPADYFIFGHYHCTERYDLGEGRAVVLLGEWIDDPSYARLDERGNLTQHRYAPIS